MKVLFAMFIATVRLVLVISLIKNVKKHEKWPPSRHKEFTTGFGLYRFSKAEIENAINFCNKKSLGRGRAGEVYKGVLPSRQVVAIKHINESNTQTPSGGKPRVSPGSGIRTWFASSTSTARRETIGYMDPEYMSNGKLMRASDVYSFGIVTLQVLSGQKVIALDLNAKDQLTRKVKDVTMGKRPSLDFEDSRLEENFNRTDFETFLKVAVFCVAKSSKDRPTIDVIFDEMDRVWKNTVTDKKIKKDTDASTTSFSRSWDVIPV